LISLGIAIAMLKFSFRRNLPWKQDAAEVERLRLEIEQFDPWELVENKRVLLLSAIILGLTVIGFALAQFLGVGMDYIALAGGTAALLFAGDSVEKTIGKVNWTVVLFFVGLFLIIGCVESTGALVWLAESVVKLSGSSMTRLMVLLTGFSAVTSSVVDNIPVAATLIPIVDNISNMGFAEEPLWWSLVLGCNLGGNGTPIGSISCVIAIHALHKEEGIHVGWGEFIKLGGLIMLVQVFGATLYLLLFRTLNWFPAL
jgi:Na+/H+ antiporter NhaD/arsenite permease-like protein